MGFTYSSGLRAGLVAGVLLVASSWAAQQHELMGATRETVLAQRGEPRSVMAGGEREFLFFAKEKFVLLRGVVVEVEALPTEPAPRRVAPPATPAPAAGQNENAAVTGAAASAGAPASGAADGAPAPATTRAQGESQPVVPETADPAPVREPEFTIKSVRAPGAPPPASTVRSAAPAPVVTDTPTPAPSVASTASKAPATSAAPAPVPVATVPQNSAPATISPATAPAPSTNASTVSEPIAAAAAAAEEPKPATSEPAAAQSPDVEQPEAVKKSTAAKPPTAGTTDSEGGLSSSAIIGGVLVAAIGFLVWRRRQRQLELAATAVSRDPVAGEASVGTTRTVVRFNADQLSRLDWKAFEELVAAYYGKTGVVAVRTKAGPSSPVHIKISWKGESRPFALVQCIAQPPGAVGVKPLQDLVAVLTAEDIRRGYVVTTGKFDVEAREFAEEKHLTLLPGDAFLEKLNALPDSARAEVMHEVFVADGGTPSCPKCEAKMVRAPENPGILHCPTHPDVTSPAR